MYVNDIEKIEITCSDRKIIIRNPLRYELRASHPDKWEDDRIHKVMFEYDSGNIFSTRLDEGLDRICIWCQADISKIPIDSTNCCYCGGELDGDEEPEGATKSAPPENILAIPAPSISISEEILKNLKIRFEEITPEDNPQVEDEDYLPLVPESIDQGCVEPKRDEVPYIKFNTKTNKHEFGYYNNI